jgi:NAD(P)-dependent dehydrogenase (short-subunit alcohol dehydrogenase family)
MFEDLSKKTALVTGASGGLGAHFSSVLAGCGVHVLLAARRVAALSEVVARINATGGHVSPIELDVSDADSVRALEHVLGNIDVLVNNAGVVRGGPALEQSESDWDIVMDTNLKGMFLVAQACGRAMRAHGRGGSIINVASILGLRQTGQVLPYAVSKAGVIQLTKCLALELSRFGIRVNALAPGYLDTDLNRDFLQSESGIAMVRRIPQRRVGQLRELDGPLLLLASEASSYMTGSVLAVDGGHLVSGL